MTFSYTLTGGDKKTDGEKKYLLKCIQKSNVIKKNFGFYYLVTVIQIENYATEIIGDLK